MKKTTIFLLLFLGITQINFAQEDSAKIDDIKKMFKLFNMDKTMDMMMEGMKAGVKQNMKSIYEGKNYEVAFDKLMDFMTVEMKDIMKSYETDIIYIYDRNFTHEEIKDINRFYETSTGKKILAKMPELMKEGMQTMQSKYLPELMEKMKVKMKELADDIPKD
jgi:hypothetical protein